MITLNDARSIIAAAEKKATEVGQPMNIAVADAGGNLIAHVRMDGTWIGSIDISIKKAFTARAFDIATKDLAKHSQSGGQFFGIHASNDGRIMIFAGGVPLKRDGKVVGAIGVSGGSGEQDHTVAEAGGRAKQSWQLPAASGPNDISAFIDCLEQGRLPDVPADAAARTQQALMAVYRSAAQGEAVLVDPVA